MGSKKDVGPYLTRIAKLRNGIGATLISPGIPFNCVTPNSKSTYVRIPLSRAAAGAAGPILQGEGGVGWCGYGRRGPRAASPAGSGLACGGRTAGPGTQTRNSDPPASGRSGQRRPRELGSVGDPGLGAAVGDTQLEHRPLSRFQCRLHLGRGANIRTFAGAAGLTVGVGAGASPTCRAGPRRQSHW